MLSARSKLLRAEPSPLPRHVAIIMDGNGRWAAERGMPREAGHRRGADAVRETVRCARELGVSVLTLYAFSAQNWSRPPGEIAHLMALLRTFLIDERAELLSGGIRVTSIGEEERLPRLVRGPLGALRQASARNDGMTLCLALSYGGRESLVAAARRLAHAACAGNLLPQSITARDVGEALDTRGLPPVDLLIRTSGEQRLSNFLPWESVYAELYFTPVRWPDFGRAHLEEAMACFAQRQRRFGA